MRREGSWHWRMVTKQRMNEGQRCGRDIGALGHAWIRSNALLPKATGKKLIFGPNWPKGHKVGGMDIWGAERGEGDEGKMERECGGSERVVPGKR